MPYVCLDCGEKEEFYKDIEGNESFARKDYYNCDGEHVEYGDQEYCDNTIDFESTLMCCSCESDNIDELDNDEWENFNLEEYNEKNKSPKTWKDRLTTRKKK